MNEDEWVIEACFIVDATTDGSIVHAYDFVNDKELKPGDEITSGECTITIES